MLTILALDLGTKTGWATSHGDLILSGTVDFKNQRFEGGGMRFLRFRRYLDELLTLQPFGEVVFEEVRRHLGVDAAHAYGGFLGQLTSWCEDKKIPYSSLPVATIKKHVTGKGNASKKLVIEAMETLGYEPCDDNEADAIALLITHKALKKIH